MERTLVDLFHFQIAGIILHNPPAAAEEAKALTTTYAAVHSTTQSPSSTSSPSGDSSGRGGGRGLLMGLLPSSPAAAAAADSAYCPSSSSTDESNGGLDDDGSSDLGIGTETRTAQTEHYSSTELEERKRFVIRSVIHPPESGQEISLKEAVETGVISHAEGTYVNKATGEARPILVAMKEGLINVIFTTTKRSKEKKSSVGVITVKTIRQQTRPYRVQTVLDTRTGKEMTREEAVERNIIDEGQGTYLNRQTGRKMLIAEAVQLGLVSGGVECPAAATGATEGGDVPPSSSSCPPDVISQTYAVHGVVDRARQKVVSFVDALRRDVVDRETGTYRDTLTGQRMDVGEAILQGYMKARVVDTPDDVPTRQQMINMSSVDGENTSFTFDCTEEEVVVIKPTAELQ